MAGKSDAFELDILKLIFNGTGITGLADNTATSPLTSLQFALHSTDPGEAGTQSTNEVTYTGYARAAVARTAAALPSAQASGISSVSPASLIGFPQCTGGSANALFWSVGVGASGATKILYYGVIGTAQGAFTATTAANITVPGHSFAVGDRVAFASSSSNVLPGGMTEGAIYYIASVSGDVVTISATSGGAAITSFTTSGHGAAFKDAGILISSGVTPQLSTSTMVIED